MISAFGWRAIFLINLPLGLAALIIGARCIDESADPGPAGLDWVGQGLGLAWLAALAYGLINARSLGWGAPGTVAALAVAGAAAAAFFVVERRRPTPMLPLQTPQVVAAHRRGSTVCRRCSTVSRALDSVAADALILVQALAFRRP